MNRFARRTIPFFVSLTMFALGSGQAIAATGGTLTPTTAFDFGSRQVGAGASTGRTYTVTSTAATAGADDLAIDSVSLTGPDAGQFLISADNCTGRTLTPAVKTCTISVQFSPGRTGQSSLGIQVTTNGPTLTTAGAITGTGRDLEADPATLSFGALAAGTTSPVREVTLTNRAAEPYALGAVGIATANAASWEIASSTCSTTTPLAQGQSCVVGLRFKPSGATGQKAGSLTVAGLGPNPVTLNGEAGQPAVRLAPARRYFGVVDPGASAAEQRATLTNTGNLPLHVGQVALRGDDPDRFAIGQDGCQGATVSPGASCTVAIGFSPDSPGWSTARLRLNTDSTPSRVLIGLSGRGAGRPSSADPTFSQSLDLADTPLARFQGDGRDAVSSVASGSCDLSGSGYSDLVAGATTWSRDPVANDWEGAVYVYPGGPDFGGADLADRSGPGVLIAGEPLLADQAAGNQTGSVACADVNGDGIDDLVIGAWAYQYPGRQPGTAAARGSAYVVFGAPDFFTRSAVDLSSLGGRGFRIQADPGNTLRPDEQDAYDHLGFAVADLGDLNGDGKDEIGVMANTGDTNSAGGRTNNGLVFVVPGKSDTRTVDVSDPSQVLMRIDGASPGSHASPWGQMIGLDGLGDVNGDGTPDVGVSSYTAVMFGRSTASGVASVVSGRLRGEVDLADADSYLFTAGGAYAGNRFGSSIAGAGDVNGDGLDDVVVGAYPTSSANSPGAYVLYGSRTPRAGADADGALDAADLGSRGYRILAPPPSRAGFSVDGVGDANGDGLDDVVVGAEGSPTSSAGQAWVVYGVADALSLPANDASSGLVPANTEDHTHYIATAGLTPEEGTGIAGQTIGERFGRAVAGIGDVSGNGSNAIAFGSDSAYRLGRTGAGEVTVGLPDGPPLPYTPEDDHPGPGPGEDPGPGTSPGPKPKAKRVSVRTALAPLALKGKRRGLVRVKLACARRGGACKGRVWLNLAGRSGRRVGFKLAAGRVKRVSLRLTRAQLRVAARRAGAGRTVKARLTVLNTRKGAHSVRQSRPLRLRVTGVSR